LISFASLAAKAFSQAPFANDVAYPLDAHKNIGALKLTSNSEIKGFLSPEEETFFLNPKGLLATNLAMIQTPQHKEQTHK
jgi:hypothetical protein